MCIAQTKDPNEETLYHELIIIRNSEAQFIQIQQLPTFPFFAEHIDMRMTIHTDPIVFLKLKSVNGVACQLLGATIETGRQNLQNK